MRTYRVYRTPEGDFLSTKELKKHYKLGFYTVTDRFGTVPGWEILEPTHSKVYINEDLGIFGRSYRTLAKKFNYSPNWVKYQVNKKINGWGSLLGPINRPSGRLAKLTEVR